MRVRLKLKQRKFPMANSLAHTKWVCKYHIVFPKKYRRKGIYYGLREDIRQIIRDLCKLKGVEIAEEYMMPDYIRLLFEYTAEDQHIRVYGVSQR